MTRGVPQRRIGVAVPAAGSGRRMGGRRKAWLALEGEPLLRRALRPFLGRDDVVAVAVALSPDDARRPPAWLLDLDPRVTVVAGGESRSESVARAAEAIPPEATVILVHDAARPLVGAEVIERVVEGIEPGVGVVPGLPVVDTLKRVDAGGRIVETPPRDGLWRAQTPQGFPAPLLRRALAAAARDPEGAPLLTDDAMAVAAVGGEVRMVRGAARNLKITRPDDLPLAAWYLQHPEEGR